MATTTLTRATGITWDIQERIQKIQEHQRSILLERDDPIHFIWVNRVAQQHILLVGGPGTAKSQIARNTMEHITGGKKFETAFDETSGPEVAFGPPDIKGMVEDRISGWVIENMLPEAWDAFLDEFFNANGPLLHSIQPVLNERIFHNGNKVLRIPLRSMIAATNQLNAEISQRALWDRIHQRHVIHPLRARSAMMTMVDQAVQRMAAIGRGVRTEVGDDLVTVSVEELDQAQQESLAIERPLPVLEVFFDLCDTLRGELGVEVSGRRQNEGMLAALANAWVRGHEVLEVSDLDVLSHMWWNTEEQRLDVRNTIMTAVNPSDKAAMDGEAVLEEVRKEWEAGVLGDSARLPNIATEAIMNARRVISQAEEDIEAAKENGWSTDKLERLSVRSNDLIIEISQKMFGV